MKFLFLLTLCFLLHAPLVHAQETTLDHAAFADIPILHEGRVKPLDTFARAYLQQLHGKQMLDKQTAAAWLAESIFRPDMAIKKPFIHIPNERIARALELPTEKGKLHSYQEVAEAYAAKRDMVIALINKGEDNLNRYELDFIDFYSLINDYSQITRALTPVLPSTQPISAAYGKKLGLDGSERNYLALIKTRDQVVADTEVAIKKYENNITKYSPLQQEAAMLAFYFANVEATGKQNKLLRVVPAFLGDPSQWHAPWALLNGGHGSPQGSELLGQWGSLAEAYHQQDAVRFSELATQIRAATIDTQTASNLQLDLEVLYYQLNPTLWIMICYGLVFMMLLMAIISPRFSKLPAAPLLMVGIVIHFALIISRIFILERPPVGTLYESVLFVALIAVLLAWRLDKHTDSHEGMLIGSLLGAFLVGISGLFAPEGDTLGVLVAVLNTNFWLATHVICITIGYGCALVAGTMAHAYLFKCSDAIGKKLQTTALIALLFTAIGTILGGIWADQSWGRFWGWDPKENGALAIVIWLVWLLHGRIVGHLKGISFAACLAFTNIIVALSWFGVNLLNVGLHSYGFTDSAALGLAAFCGIEFAIIIALTIHAKRLQKHER